MKAIVNIYVFLIFLAFLAAYIAIRVLIANSNAKKEKKMLQTIVPRKLGLKGNPPNYNLLQRSILALIPCKGVVMEGKLAPLGNHSELWLCFLKNRLLFISKKTQDVIELSMSELVKLRLLDKSKTVTIELKGGKSRFELKRLEDLVKLINVLISHGIELDYEEG